MPNIIEHLTIETSGFQQSDVVGQSATLNKWAKQERLWKEVDVVLDQFGTGDTVILIPYIELSLSASNADEFISNFVFEFKKNISNLLKSKEIVDRYDKDEQNDSTFSAISKRDRLIKAFLHFLTYGVLENSFPNLLIVDFQRFLHNIPKEKNDVLFKSIMTVIQANKFAQYRFDQILGKENLIPYLSLHLENTEFKPGSREVKSIMEIFDLADNIYRNTDFNVHDEHLNDLKLDKNIFYIKNAGIVLLAPYLDQLFSALRLLEEGQFVNKEAQQKAITILHYVSTGSEEVNEYEVPLLKLLCNFPILMPIDHALRISESEREVIDQLLTFVISQWEIMKNSSPEGLRQNFLIRDGKLFQNEENRWHLKVHRKTEDILLDQLPYGWSFSMIKARWMDDIIFVEW